MAALGSLLGRTVAETCRRVGIALPGSVDVAEDTRRRLDETDYVEKIQKEVTAANSFLVIQCQSTRGCDSGLIFSVQDVSRWCSF